MAVKGDEFFRAKPHWFVRYSVATEYPQILFFVYFEEFAKRGIRIVFVDAFATHPALPFVVAPPIGF